MSDIEQVDEVEAPTPAVPDGDEDAYEDSWYQVLRRLAPGGTPSNDG
jgi:hypothetical protein